VLTVCGAARRAAEQSSSAGLLVADQLQVGDGGVEVVFGCETKETGEIYNQEADGILGLGNSEVSLVNQVRALMPARGIAYNVWEKCCKCWAYCVLRGCAGPRSTAPWGGPSALWLISVTH